MCKKIHDFAQRENPRNSNSDFGLYLHRDDIPVANERDWGEGEEESIRQVPGHLPLTRVP